MSNFSLKRITITIYSIGLILFIGVSIFASLKSKDILKRFDLLDAKHIQLENANELLYLDEVLTNSARNFIYTNDSIWLDRYIMADTTFTNVATKSRAQNINEDSSPIFNLEDSITQKLFSYERMAFEQIAQNNSDSAIALIESDAYKQYKDIYSKRILRLQSDAEYGNSFVSIEINEVLTNGNKGINFFIILLTGVLIVIGVLGYFIFKSFRKIGTLNNTVIQSEEKYRFLTENIIDVIWVVDAETMKFTYMSPSVKNLRGYTADEVIAQGLKSTLSPESQKNVDDILPARIARFKETGNKEVYTDKLRQPCKDGSMIWTEIVTYFRINPQNTRIELIGTTRNIDDREKAELKLIESQKSHMNLMNSSVQGFIKLEFKKPLKTDMAFEEQIIWVMENLYVSESNNVFAKMYGFKSSDEIIGMSVVDLWEGEETTREIIELFITGGYEWINLETEELTAEGKVKFFVQNLISIYNDDNEIVEMWSSQVDITKRKLAEVELNKSKVNLSEAQRIGNIGSWEYNIITKKPNWSDEMYRIFGLKPQEIEATFEKYLEYIHQDDRNMVIEAYNDSVESKTPYDIIHRLMLKDGTIKYVNERCETIYDSDGSPIRSIGMVQDITKQHLAEEALIESEIKFRSIFNSSVDAIGVLKNDKHITVNPAYLELFGYTELNEIYERPVLDLIAKNKRPTIKKLFLKRLSKEEMLSIYETRGLRKNGEEFDLDVHVSTYKLHGEDYNLVILRDITNRKITEDELIHAKEKAEESDRLKSAFLASMSHEIRTPLNAIVGFSSIIADQSQDPELKDYSDLINTQNDLMLQLIDDLIDFSIIESGTIEITNESFDLNLLLNNISTLFDPKCSTEVTLKQKSQYKSIIIFTDENRLNQVFTNLISNAIKFTKKGQITFGYELDDKSELRCFVHDTGIGIPLDKQDEIFERFTKLDTFSQGTGLGLSITKNIVKLLNGRIWLESKPGEGTSFYFKLPFKVESSSIEEEESKIIKKNHKKSISSKITILVAENNMPNFQLAEKILRAPNINILNAVNGIEAVNICKSNKDIDIVLMDIKMPELDGFEATRQIKKVKPDLPIIACTAYVFHNDKMKAKEAGCDGYISKPINKNDLLELISQLLD